MANYSIFDIPLSYKNKLKKFFLGTISVPENIRGNSEQCKNIYLTGQSEIIKNIANKVIIIDTQKIWSDMSLSKKQKILECFDVTNDDMSFFSNSSDVLFTQCFSEDNYCSEEIKIKMYKDIVNCFSNVGNLIVKPHPREITDYSVIFPEAVIYKKKIPIEILILLGVKIERAITVNSSAVYNFPKTTKTIILGDEFCKKYF